jgi:hypothetical protein
MIWYNKEEIYQHYKNADSKKRALKTLAELNACKVEDIKEIVDEMAKEEETKKRIAEIKASRTATKKVEKEPVEDIPVMKSKGTYNRYSGDLTAKIEEMLIEGKDYNDIIVACNLPINGTGSKQKIYKIKRQLINEGKLHKTETLKSKANREKATKIEEPKAKIEPKPMAKTEPKVEPIKSVKVEPKAEPKPTPKAEPKPRVKTVKPLNLLSSSLIPKATTEQEVEDMSKSVNKDEAKALLKELKAKKSKQTKKLVKIQEEIKNTDRMIKFLEELV